MKQKQNHQNVYWEQLYGRRHDRSETHVSKIIFFSHKQGGMKKEEEQQPKGLRSVYMRREHRLLYRERRDYREAHLLDITRRG